MKKVSVIVPVYNVEHYLSKCLDSLVNQTIDDYEIIIVNDGSPDDSQSIIDEYQKKYPDLIKSFIKENGGLSDARNYGMEKANGEYVSFVDSDDYLKDSALKEMYDFAVLGNYDLVVCDTVNVYDDGREQLIKSNLDYSEDMVKNYIISPPMACTRFYKRSIFYDLK